MVNTDSNDSSKIETEFNSSVATLRRIDDLMRQLHDLSRGLIPTNKFGYPLLSGNPHELYLTTTNRLYLEGHVKFSQQEKIDCLTIKEDIEKIKKRFGINLKLSEISQGMPPKKYVNPKYYTGWEELVVANARYETKIVELLDHHNMLMKNKDDGEYALR